MAHFKAIFTLAGSFGGEAAAREQSKFAKRIQEREEGNNSKAKFLSIFLRPVETQSVGRLLLL